MPQWLIQPRTFAFVQHNVMEPLAFASTSFDLTHMRQMMGVLPVAAWPRVVGEMVRVTVYGGWIELVERIWCATVARR